MFCIVSISSSNSSCSSNVLNEHVQGTRHKSSYIHNIITWLLYFFPGFDRFIPGFDRFIPGFDRFIPVSIPVTEIFPHPKPPHHHHHHNPNAHSSIKCVLFLYFDITSYHFIWNSYFQLEKKCINAQNNYLPEKNSWHQSNAFTVSFQWDNIYLFNSTVCVFLIFSMLYCNCYKGCDDTREVICATRYFIMSTTNEIILRSN